MISRCLVPRFIGGLNFESNEEVRGKFKKNHAVERTLDIYLKTLTPITGKREQYLPLSKLAENTPYSAKYLNLLIRQGKLTAHKEGRLWLSTKEAVDNYIKNRKRQV